MHLTIPSTTTDCPGGHWCPDPVREEISQDTIRRLIRSMPKHCWECIQARGGHIHYWVTLRVAVILFMLVGVACDFNYLSCLSCYTPYSGSTATLFFFCFLLCLRLLQQASMYATLHMCTQVFSSYSHTHVDTSNSCSFFKFTHRALAFVFVCVRRPKHESLPSPHAAVNHSPLQGIWAVSTPLSSLFHALPPCVLMRGPGKCLELCEEGRMRGWKKEVVVRLMPEGLGLGSSASWEKMVGKRSVVLTHSYIHEFIHLFLSVSQWIPSWCYSVYSDCLSVN